MSEDVYHTRAEIEQPGTSEESKVGCGDRSDICHRCILHEGVKGVSLGADGICNVCKASDHVDVATMQSLEGFVSRLRGVGRGRYDVLCMYSGGKDSTFMLHALSGEHGLRVLALTLDNGFISEQTRQNIRRTLDALGTVDHIFIRPSEMVMAKTFEIGCRLDRDTPLGKKAYLVGHVCLPCFSLLTYYGAKVALEKGIRNVVVGTTPGQLTQKNIDDLTDTYRSSKDALRELALPFLAHAGKSNPDIARSFRLGLLEKARAFRLNLVFFYRFHSYSETEIRETIETQLGWKPPSDTDSCSTNCLINALGVYLHRTWYGISPYTIPLAADVRSGLVDRQAALAQVHGDVNMETVKRAAEHIGVSDLL